MIEWSLRVHYLPFYYRLILIRLLTDHQIWHLNLNFYSKKSEYFYFLRINQLVWILWNVWNVWNVWIRHRFSSNCSIWTILTTQYCLISFDFKWPLNIVDKIVCTSMTLHPLWWLICWDNKFLNFSIFNNHQ